MLAVGLSGGIGCGKSLVSDIFNKKFKAPVIDADFIAKEISEQPHISLLLKKALGNDFFNEDKILIRDKLRKAVFDNSKLREKLESILHPLVYDEIEHSLELTEGEYCVVVIPLLLEKKRTHFIDRILMVDCTEEEQIKRVTLRDQCSVSHVEAIVSTQISREKRLNLADDVIVNSGTMESIHEKIAILHEKYIKLNRSLL